MMLNFFRKIHPQFPLGVFLGLTVTFFLQGQSQMNLVYHLQKQEPAAERQMVDGFGKNDVRPGIGKASVGDELHAMMDDVGSVKEHKFEDAHAHNDDDSVAKALYKQVRVLCWVMTSPTTLWTKAIHVRNTWAHRCNVMLFMSSEDDKEFPAIGLNVSEGRDHLTAKTMQAFSYIYDTHLDDAEWFMKADDDTYVILENLRYMLANEDHEEPVYFGHKFKAYIAQGYTSGGGGYVMSKEALKRYGQLGRNNTALCAQDKGAEDVAMGRCMKNLGVSLKSSLDSLGRSRFHCFNPDMMAYGKFPSWYHKFDMEGVLGGVENISDYAISFHYMPPQKMYSMEFLTYHLQTYGIVNKAQHLNTNRRTVPN